MRLHNLTLDRPLCRRVIHARTAWARTRGLIGRPPPSPGEGLLLDPCRGVHMFFMRSALDVIFLDERWRVVAIYPRLRPWRMTRLHGEARYALEVAPGTVEAAGLMVGHELAPTAE